MDTQERVTSLVLNSGGSPEIVAGILAIFAEERAPEAWVKLAEAVKREQSRAEEAERERDRYHDDLNNWRSQCITEMNKAEQSKAREAALVSALRALSSAVREMAADLKGNVAGCERLSDALIAADAALACSPVPPSVAIPSTEYTRTGEGSTLPERTPPRDAAKEGSRDE